MRILPFILILLLIPGCIPFDIGVKTVHQAHIRTLPQPPEQHVNVYVYPNVYPIIVETNRP